MSADNWTFCPRCEKTQAITRKKLEEKTKTSYGKATEEEYIRLKNEASKPQERQETLREDYNIGIADGEFVVKYIARCKKCGFEFIYNYAYQKFK